MKFPHWEELIWNIEKNGASCNIFTVYVCIHYIILCRHNISMPYQDVFLKRVQFAKWWNGLLVVTNPWLHSFQCCKGNDGTGDGMGPLYPCLKCIFVVRPFNLPPIFSCFFFPWNMGVSPIGSLPLKQSHMTSMVVAHPNQSTTPKPQPTKKNIRST